MFKPTISLYFSGGICKHMAGVILYVNEHRDESQTDKTCSFIEPSKLAKSIYPRGEEIEKIYNIPENLRMPKCTFDMISDEEKEYHANLMLKHGNTASPLYTVFSERLPSTASEPQDYDNLLPEWLKTRVFADTNDIDIPFQVITFKEILGSRKFKMMGG